MTLKGSRALKNVEHLNDVENLKDVDLRKGVELIQLFFSHPLIRSWIFKDLSKIKASF